MQALERSFEIKEYSYNVQTPIGLEALVLQNSWNKTGKVSPKIGPYPGL